MFDNNIKTEPTPERVYELCKIISKGEIQDSVAKERMEPSSINTTSTSYYSSIREVLVKELNIVESENNILRFTGDKKILKSMDTFRVFCNSRVFQNRDSYFYKIVQCFLESNDNWFKYKTLTDAMLRIEVQDATGIALVEDKMMLGSRFWISFLGFGYIQEGVQMFYLPNMYKALQDYCELAELEKNREYSVREFAESIYEYASVALRNIDNGTTFNLAMSNALRDMHDNKEIELKMNLDSEKTWLLFKDETHLFQSEFTHIIYKGVKRR